MTTEEEIKQLKTELANLKKWEKISTAGIFLALLVIGIVFIAQYFKKKDKKVKDADRVNWIHKELIHQQEKIKKMKGEIRLIKALMTLSEEARQRKIEKPADSEDEWDDSEEEN